MRRTLRAGPAGESKNVLPTLAAAPLPNAGTVLGLWPRFAAVAGLDMRIRIMASLRHSGQFNRMACLSALVKRFLTGHASEFGAERTD